MFAAKSRELWQHTKDELKHYWLGSKLLWQEIRLSSGLLSRVLTGHTLTRRERQQLLKTSADMFRLVSVYQYLLSHSSVLPSVLPTRLSLD